MLRLFLSPFALFVFPFRFLSVRRLNFNSTALENAQMAFSGLVRSDVAIRVVFDSTYLGCHHILVNNPFFLTDM